MPSLLPRRLSLLSFTASESRHVNGQRRRFHPKERERNFFAAACSMIVIVILCTALAEPDWISMRGGGCNLDSLGVCQFFYSGYFEVSVGKPLPLSTYHYKSSSVEETMVNCVTPPVVAIMKSIIGLTFLGILCSMCAFLLDLFGPEARALKLLRRNAVGNIFTVIVCVVINGFCFWATGIVLHLQTVSKPHEGSKVLVAFDVSFYLVVAAGALSVVATACNCLRKYPPVQDDDQMQMLVEDWDDTDLVRTLTEPPPPPYVP